MTIRRIISVERYTFYQAIRPNKRKRVNAHCSRMVLSCDHVYHANYIGTVGGTINCRDCDELNQGELFTIRQQGTLL